MRSRTRLLIPLVVLALVTVACGINLPNSTTIDVVATNVAATVQALAGTAIVALTPEAHTLPTVELPTVTPPPAFAPLHLSFVSPDRDLYVWDETMPTAQKIVDSGDVSATAISADGSLVAFTRSVDYNNYSLEVIAFDGSGQQVLMDAAAFAALPRPDGAVSSIPSQMAFVPGTHTLAFNVRQQYEGPGLAFGTALYLANLDSGTISSILDVGSSWKFTYSPDGSKIAISLPTGIAIYNADGSLVDGNVLTYPFVNTASEYAWVASPAWSADSTTLMVAVPPQDPWTEPVGNGSLWHVAADGLSGEMTSETPMMYFPSGFAFISPDLTKVIFFTRLGAATDNIQTLHTASVDGTADIEYTTGQFDSTAAWSPDNVHFFYTVRDGPGTISYIGAIGGAAVLVPDITNAGNITWVDATRYIVSTSASGTGSMLLGNLSAPTGVIFNGSGSDYMSFSVNR